MFQEPEKRQKDLDLYWSLININHLDIKFKLHFMLRKRFWLKLFIQDIYVFKSVLSSLPL